MGKKNQDRATAVYIHQIRQAPLLEKSDEKCLAKIIAKAKVAQEKLMAADGSGDHLRQKKRKKLEKRIADGQAAANRFIIANLRLVVHFAKQARREKYPKIPLLHLIQFGSQGLFSAVRKFEWQRGNRFSTYARDWIVSAIDRGKHKDSSGMASLDAQLSDGDEAFSRYEVLHDEKAVCPVDSASNSLVAEVVQEAMKNLKKADGEVLSLLLFSDLSVNEVAEKLGKTTDKVRKLRDWGLAYLKRHEKVKKLKL